MVTRSYHHLFIDYLVLIKVENTKNGIIRNEIYLFVFYRSVNSGDLLTRLTVCEKISLHINKNQINKLHFHNDTSVVILSNL